MIIGKLNNGLKYAIKERKDLNTVTISVWIKTGSAYEDDSNRGIAHFLEHMMFNSSKNLPPGTLDREIELMGGEINAATSYDYTYYYINVPYNHYKRALELLTDFILNPLLSEEMVEKEKPIVLEEIARSKDNPQDVFAETLMNRLYSKAPYKYPILGFEDTVKKIDSQTLRTFYENNYVPDRMAISVVGKIDAEEVKKNIQELWEDFKRKGKVKNLENEPAENKGGEFTVTHPAVQIPQLVLAWKLPPCSRDDVYYEILDSFLSSGKSAYLYNRIREKGFAYSCYSNYQNLLLGSNFIIGAMTDNVELCLEELKKVIEEILSISEEDFEFARKKLLKNELFSRESGETEADNIGYAVSIIEDESYYLEYITDIKQASFTKFKEKVKFLMEPYLIGFLLP
ncbi:Predicted Zn-dependent peptidase [Desulfurobacterium pacificum]|uniref:Predicted Zn-dependent peptidase n=1 Tax=Desulfurobacterium pacificum TaxID=240166 RepID=A0ABY1N9W9_9BACT|nr:pitrilysin family protein [Desulfurobacterium pacificum]SMP03696.1 Predicted Zn-dependent peptidase [Desulfurobacterium pacificum]